MGQGPSGRLIARCLRATVAAGAVALAVGTPAASAQQDPQGSAPAIAPPADHCAIRTDAAPVTATGNFNTKNPGSNITSIQLQLAWTGPATRPGLPNTKELCGTPAAAGCGQPSASYSAILSPVDTNGPYHVSVTATATDLFGSTSTLTLNADFVLAIPPKTPTGLKATASKDRKVTLVWDRNGEADLYFYDVGRKGPGEKGFTIIVKETQPPPNVKPTFQEDKPPTAAGDYQYQVTAVRYGQSGDSNPAFLLRSAPAGPVTVKLGPGSPGHTTPPTQPPPAGLATGPPVLKFSGGAPPKLSTAKPSTTSGTEEVTPDPGFVRGLPYSGRGTPDDSGDNPAVELNRKGGKGGGNNRGVLVPGAVGAILFVGAFQLRWLMRTIDQPLIPPIT